MLAAFRALPLLWRLASIIGGIAVILGVAGGVYLWIDHQGYRRAELEWTVKYQQREAELQRELADEIKRQAEANADAKAAEEAELEVYRQQLLKMAKLAQQLSTEAAADPNHDNIALDAAAVDRHNRGLVQ